MRLDAGYAQRAPRLDAEAFDRRLIRHELGMKDLDCVLRVDVNVSGLVDYTHTPSTKHGLDPVLAVEELSPSLGQSGRVPDRPLVQYERELLYVLPQNGAFLFYLIIHRRAPQFRQQTWPKFATHAEACH